MENTIVMNTQVSLSRNINNYPFPHKLNAGGIWFIVFDFRIPKKLSVASSAFF